MSFDGEKDQPGCPYFVKSMQSCGLYSDGLYMPLRERVVEHCLTTRHRQCPIYRSNQPSPERGSRDTEPETGRDRRSHHRFREEASVILCTCDEQGNTIGDFHETAATVDFSQAGLRVKTNRKLPSGKPLLCRFSEDFCVPFLRGIALVCWQRETNGSPHPVEAGLFFYDSSSRSRLARELGC